MRILYFTESDSPHDRRFLVALGKTKHQVYALRQKSYSPEEVVGIIGVEWPQGQPDWMSWQGWQGGIEQLKIIISNIKPDLVHAGPIQGPALVTALTGFHPLLTMSWGSDILLRARRSPWMQFATRYVLDHTDIFLADCKTVAIKAEKYGYKSKPVVTFPWGVDLEHFSLTNGDSTGKKLRQTLGWQDNFIIFCNRSWSPVYGVDLLAKAFVKAVHKDPNLRLILAGTGPKEGVIQNILNSVHDKVVYPGNISLDDLPGFYCAANLFISPSYCDGSSISLIEALACSKPVLVSDIPSNQEWVVGGVNGELFNTGDKADLTQKIFQMAEDPDLENFGKKARNIAESKADWKLNFQQLLNAYEMSMEK